MVLGSVQKIEKLLHMMLLSHHRKQLKNHPHAPILNLDLVFIFIFVFIYLLYMTSMGLKSYLTL